MCGICGIVNFNSQSVTESHLVTMMNCMRHRGPDDEGVYIEKNVGLGFVRLSIIDLSPMGHQPMFSDDRRYVIVFNGEIFNYLELRKELNDLGYHFKTFTDTEVLLTSYIHWGKDCLHHFNGMWAFVIFNNLSNEIFAARDRFGVKPFYYSLTNRQFLFASDIPSILKILPAKPSANGEVINDYLVFNRTDQSEKTFFNEVVKLPHGHCLSFNTKSESIPIKPLITRWYDLKSNLKSPFESPSELRAGLKASLGLRLRSDVPIGVCLSGGLDSSAIVSTLLKDFGAKDLNTFSAVYGKGVAGDESVYIEEYRESLKNMHFTTPTVESLLNDIPDFVRAHSEPIPTISPYAQYKVMELASKSVVVTLDGQGADEQLAGYHYFFGFYFKEMMMSMKWLKLISESSHYLLNHKSGFGFSSMSFFLLPSSLQSKLRIMKKGYLSQQFIKRSSGSDSISSKLYSSGSLHEALLDHFEYKLEHLLKWEDRNSMWFSLEARVPFLDYNFVEKTLSMPPEKLIKDGMTKYFLREAMVGTLPEKIRVRKDKTGFAAPSDAWFRKDCFRNYTSNILQSESFRSRNIYDLNKVEDFYERFLTGKNSGSNEVWKWIHLENWYRQYID